MYTQLRLEDKYGCRTLFTAVSTLYNQGEIDVVESESVKDNETGRNSYLNISKQTMEGLGVDYIIVIFDLDPYDRSTDMLTWEELLGSIENKAVESDIGRYIDILDENNPEYMGNRVVIAPIFFCFETLYFLEDNFFSLWGTLVNKFDGGVKACALNKHIPEIMLNYINYKNNNTRYEQIQTVYTNESNKCIREITKNDNASKDAKKKKKYFLYDWVIGRNGDYDINKLAQSITEKAIFNKEYGELLSIKTTKELENFIAKYNFHTYKKELERKMKLYESIVTDDFRSQSVINAFLKFCRDTKDNETANTASLVIEQYRKIKHYT